VHPTERNEARPCSRYVNVDVVTRHEQPVTGIGLSEFADQHGLGLVRFALLVSGDHGTAEDLVQETLQSLFRRFGHHLPLEDPVAYARRAIVNANISWTRRKMTALTSVSAAVPDTVAPGDTSDGIAERQAMWHALSRLSDRQRAVLVLRFYCDSTDEQIASTLGCRPATVRSLAARGLAALRADSVLRRQGEST
jgi:RNA polymerase sigma-70 factor (sigma-E family)